MERTRAIAAAIFAAIAASLTIAPQALAAGLLGEVTDETITFFCLGVLVFFALTVTVLSYVQHRLETRRERARAELERLREV